MSTQPQNLILSPFSLHPLSFFPSSLSSHLNLSLYPFRSFHPSHPRWTWKAIFSSPEGPEPYDIWTFVSDGWWFWTLYNSCLLTCGCTHKDVITATQSLSLPPPSSQPNKFSLTNSAQQIQPNKFSLSNSDYQIQPNKFSLRPDPTSKFCGVRGVYDSVDLAKSKIMTRIRTHDL